MKIWIPKKLYGVIPFTCLLVGFASLLASNGPCSSVLSAVLVLYGSVIIGVRFECI